MVPLRRIAVCFLLLLALCAVSPAAVIHVDIDAVGMNDGTSWEHAFVDLQSALAIAVAGDEIWVAEGIYYPTQTADPEASFELVDGVGLFGGFAGGEVLRSERDWEVHETVLSGDIDPSSVSVFEPYFAAAESQSLGDSRQIFRECSALYRQLSNATRPSKRRGADSVHVVTAVNVDGDAVLDGFWVTGGETQGEELLGLYGGGMLVVGGNPVLSNLEFTRNSAGGFGGGLAIVEGANTLLTDVRFESCVSGYQAGALYVEEGAMALMRNVSFWRNICVGIGGAVVSRGTTSLESVEFKQNYSEEQSGAGMWNTGPASFRNVRFENNFADLHGAGGGLWTGGSVTLENVVFSSNGASWAGIGGGLACFGGNPSLVNVLFQENYQSGSSVWEAHSGGGGYAQIGGSPTLVNVTLVRNATAAGGLGGGIYYAGTGMMSLTNVISWGNSSQDGAPEIYSTDATPLITHSLIAGSGGSGPAWDASLGVDGGNNIDADPRFVDLSSADVTLRAGSPAVNTGSNLALPPGLLLDLAGETRVVGSAVDMGAYEFQVPDCATFEVVTGASWDGISLQNVLDAEYGAGAVDAATGYEGYACGDAVHPYWIDNHIGGWVVREIAGFSHLNRLGWYVENFSPPTIDGVDDGLIFDGSATGGATAAVELPHGATRFGFYMNPAGSGGSTNAPEPEHFFSNRAYNDAGPDGSGDTRAPEGGDPQCLIYNITELRGGTPTYVLAWEDLDYGSPLSPTYDALSTDNDFQDMVVEIQAMSPVPVITADLEAKAIGRAVRLSWNIHGFEYLDSLVLLRRPQHGSEEVLRNWSSYEIIRRGEFTDDAPSGSALLFYRLEGRASGNVIRSDEISVDISTLVPHRARLHAAAPNPFNPSTTIRFTLPADGPASLTIYDLSGRRVRTLVDQQQVAGEHSSKWNGRDDSGRLVSSGVYLCQLRAGEVVAAERVVLLK